MPAPLETNELCPSHQLQGVRRPVGWARLTLLSLVAIHRYIAIHIIIRAPRLRSTHNCLVGSPLGWPPTIYTAFTCCGHTHSTHHSGSAANTSSPSSRKLPLTALSVVPHLPARSFFPCTGCGVRVSPSRSFLISCVEQCVR